MRTWRTAARVRATLAGLIAGAVLALGGCGAPNTGIAPAELPGGSRPGSSPATAGPVAPRPVEGYGDPKVLAMVREVSTRLLTAAGEPATAWRITVLDTPDVNAYARPSRDILLTRGLLALLDDKAQLASVIGHEVGHVLARHSDQRRQTRAATREAVLAVANATGDVDLARAVALVGLARERAYSREHEFEADRIGIRTMADAGYDSDAAVATLERLRRADQLEARRASRSVDAVDRPSGILSSHPRTLDRVVAARDLAQARRGGRTERDAYLAAIDGMLFGDRPDQGFVRGRRFEHPDIGVSFEVPPGYRLINTPQAVYAEGPDAAMMSFSCTRRQAAPVADLARGGLGAGTVGDDRSLTINGLQAATAAATRPSDKMTKRMLVIAFDPLTCGFTMDSPGAAAVDRTRELLQAAQSTFRRLTAAERSALRPQRLRVVIVRAGDTAESLAGAGGGDELAVAQFLTINGLETGDPLSPGRRVKVVVQE